MSRHRSLFCFFVASSLRSFISFSFSCFRSFFSLTACKLFLLFFFMSFHVTVSIILCKVICTKKSLLAAAAFSSTLLVYFSIGLVEIFTKQIGSLFQCYITDVTSKILPVDAEGIQSIFIRIGLFSKCIIFPLVPIQTNERQWEMPEK